MRMLLSFLLCFGFLFAGIAHADVEGTVVSQTLQSDGQILIVTEYRDTETGKLVGTADKRLWSPIQFQGKTSQEISDMITEDLNAKLTGNMMYAFQKATGEYPYESYQKQIADSVFHSTPNMVGTKVKAKSIPVLFDADNDGLCETQWVINEKGDVVKSAIAPTACG